MKSLRALLMSALSLAALAVMGLPAFAITNPRPDGGEHPYVGLAVFDVDGAPSHRCTGTLLSPTVFLTAGHCTDGTSAARVWFAEEVQGNTEYPFSGATSYDGVPYTNPEFCIGCGGGLPGFAQRDVGIIVLTEPVPTSVVSSYGQLPQPGLVDRLPSSAPVDLVGYGVQTNQRGGGQPVWTGLRNRFQADARLVSGSFKHSSEFVRVTANPGQGKGGACFGDSGGPVLIDEGRTILAVNSYVTNNNCTGVTYSQRVDIPEVLAWIRSFL
jgi:hypothetical protein